MMCRLLLFWSRWVAALVLGIAPLPGFAADTASDSSVLLVAAEGLHDPRFRQTVVLVTRHGRSRSPIGVILNRAFDAHLDRLFPQLPQAAQHRLYYGGPVAPGQIVYLLRGEVPPIGAIVFGPRLYLGSHGGNLLQLLGTPTPPTQLRVFSGFAGWAPDQLEDEIQRGDWHVLPVDAEFLFSELPEDLWPKLWRRATEIQVRVPSPRPASGGVGVQLARVRR